MTLDPMTSTLTWSYALTVNAASRLPVLSGKIDFQEIAEQISNRMEVLCCHASALRAFPDFKRPVYTVSIGFELFDLFFNSRSGYRAAYFESPGRGLDANALLMRLLGSRLAAHPFTAKTGLTRGLLVESLITPSSKVWLAERGKEFEPECDGCRGEWGAGCSGPAEVAEIFNGRWEMATGQKAEWGRKAPFLTKLRVMGAFIDERHHEIVPFDKRFRASDIHMYGWS